MRKKNHLLLTILLSLCSTMAISQDTVRVDNRTYSLYEKAKSGIGTMVSEEISEIWAFRNLKLETAILKNSAGTVMAKAIRFNAKMADGKVRLVADRSFAYLDMNEVDSFIHTLQTFIALKNQKPYTSENTISYVSRGGIYAGCYTKNNTWRAVVTVEPSSLWLSTYLTKNKLTEMTEVLQLHKQ